MKTVKVSVAVLLAKVKANRAEHEEIYKEAVVEFRKKAIETLKEQLAAAEKGEKIEAYLGLTEPTNNVKDYDTVINMLEYTTDQEVELSQSEFRQYVQDDWGWKHGFLASNSGYSAKAKLLSGD